MKTYRFLVLTFDGQLLQSLDLVFATEENAKVLARKLARSTPVELWDGPRLIARVDPKTN